jgi:probable non-F420 flavinoid oxidoreductase
MLPRRPVPLQRDGPGVPRNGCGQACPMAVYGMHASHEQIHPRRLLDFVRAAELAGFAGAMSSDHFSPWSERQGHSGFAWSWLGSALEATALPFGVVNAPGQRYHPAIVAQAMATLIEMYPDRLWVALGTGENSNEHITGDGWPEKPVRAARLLECVDVIRRLFAGETVSHDGLVRVDRARLYTEPSDPPPLYGTAVSAETAAWVGGWADGLATINQPLDRLRRVVEAFREGGGEGKPMVLQVHLSWAEEEGRALDIAFDQWRSNVFAPPVCWDLETVAHFDEAARFVRPEDVRGSVLVSADLDQHVAWLEELTALGFDQVYLHHVGKDLGPFIDAFGERVLPRLRAGAPS